MRTVAFGADKSLGSQERMRMKVCWENSVASWFPTLMQQRKKTGVGYTAHTQRWCAASPHHQRTSHTLIRMTSENNTQKVASPKAMSKTPYFISDTYLLQTRSRYLAIMFTDRNRGNHLERKYTHSRSSLEGWGWREAPPRRLVVCACRTWAEGGIGAAMARERLRTP